MKMKHVEIAFEHGGKHYEAILTEKSKGGLIVLEKWDSKKPLRDDNIHRVYLLMSATVKETLDEILKVCKITPDALLLKLMMFGAPANASY